MASLMNSSQLLKSYEQLIQQFECDFELKNSRIRDMERELQQIQVENSNLAQQLYNVKTQHPLSGPKDDAPPPGIDPSQFFSRNERDQLVEMLKRNHDIVVEKYQMQMTRVDGLEKTTIEKERMYNEIKIENDQLSNSIYKLQRSNEDLQNEKKIYESKLKNTEGLLRQFQEETRVLRMNNEKLDATAKVSVE